MFGISCFLLGTSLTMLFLGWFIIGPLQKLNRSALKSWGETLDLLAKAVEAMPKEVKKEADGSVISPIQIKE